MKTLLKNLCEVNHQQGGGTIHQFLGHNKWQRDVDKFQKAYYEVIDVGITLPSKTSFNKLAKQYHITINWNSSSW